MSEVLTLLGRGDSWETCPFNGEIWAVSTCLVTEGMENRHYDKVFAVDREFGDGSAMRAVAIAKKRGIPVVSQLAYGDEKYPLYEIMTTFKTNYIRNTASYMLALAIYQNRSPLEIFGIDQTGDYIRTKPYVTFWLGVATGRGIEYRIHSTSLMPKLIDPSKIEMTADEKQFQEQYVANKAARLRYERYLEGGSKEGEYTFDDFIRAGKNYNKGLRKNKEPWLD